MDKSGFCFELIDKETPEEVIRRSIGQIGEATNQLVAGVISKYSGYIYSYTKPIGLAAAIRSVQTSGTVDVDIQEDMGEISDESHRYEVFLTVKNIDNYKYRIMFVDYGAVAYPVTIVLNEEIMEEYSTQRRDVYNIYSMQELEDLLDKIINSQTLIKLIQSLIYESLRREKKTVDEVSP